MKCISLFVISLCMEDQIISVSRNVLLKWKLAEDDLCAKHMDSVWMKFQNSSEKWLLFRSLRLSSLVNQVLSVPLSAPLCVSDQAGGCLFQVIKTHPQPREGPEFWLITSFPMELCRSISILKHYLHSGPAPCLSRSHLPIPLNQLF